MQLRSLCVLVLLLSGCATVQPGETGLLWQPIGGGLKRDTIQPGLIVLAPWDEVRSYNLQLNTFTEQLVVLTQDDLKIDVKASVILRPMPGELYDLEMELGRDYYQKVVQPKFRTSIRSVVSNYPMIQISKNTRKIEDELKAILVDRMQGKHIEVNDVIIDEIAFSQQVLRAIEQKVAKEQEMEQMKFEIAIARKDAEITQIKAQAEADASLAKAQAQAKVQEMVQRSLTKEYLQFKALESPASKYFFIPAGQGGVPIMLNTDGR
jgi:regulator of protease activity HflC (stomatin/prohibitin superfamily)